MVAVADVAPATVRLYDRRGLLTADRTPGNARRAQSTS
ncbi:MerR family DNA-binding transcriptional regulator [Agrococcus sp. TSP3-2-1]